MVRAIDEGGNYFAPAGVYFMRPLHLSLSLSLSLSLGANCFYREILDFSILEPFFSVNVYLDLV